MSKRNPRIYQHLLASGVYNFISLGVFWQLPLAMAQGFLLGVVVLVIALLFFLRGLMLLVQSGRAYLRCLKVRTYLQNHLPELKIRLRDVEGISMERAIANLPYIQQLLLDPDFRATGANPLEYL